MANPRWKSVEREIAKRFGGVRVPLSGRNSRHTAADLMQDPKNPGPYPPWLFTEIKRDRELNKFWYENFPEAKKKIICLEYEGFTFLGMHSSAMFRRGESHPGLVRVEGTYFYPLWKIYCFGWSRAAVEKKESTLLCCQLHGRRGFFILGTDTSLWKYWSWLRENGEKYGLLRD